MLVAVGFFVTLVLAWYHGERGRQRVGRVELLLLAGVLALGGYAASRFLAARLGTAERVEVGVRPVPVLDARRIAVLYFEDLSQGQELGYLAVGFTESLIQELSGIQGLQVISRNGVKPYRAGQATMDSLATALRAGTLVEGSITESADSIRLLVQVIDAASNTHIGRQTLARPKTEPLALLDDLTNAVAAFLVKQLGTEIRLREAQAETESAVAWSQAQKAERVLEDAHVLLTLRDGSAARRTFMLADTMLAEAERVDPEWAFPTVRRGWIALWVGSDQDALALADTALSKSPDYPTALELRGIARFRVRFDQRSGGRGTSRTRDLRPAAERDLRAAVTADPLLVNAWLVLSILYRLDQREAEATLALQRAIDADEFLQPDETAIFEEAHMALDRRELAIAQRWTGFGLGLFPESPVFAAMQLLIWAAGSPEVDVDEAWDLVGVLERAVGDEPVWRMMMAAVLAQAGLRDSALSVIRSAREQGSRNPMIHFYEAWARLNLGQRDTAARRLGEYLDARPDRRTYVASDWLWEPLANEPGFRALVADSLAS